MMKTTCPDCGAEVLEATTQNRQTIFLEKEASRQWEIVPFQIVSSRSLCEPRLVRKKHVCEPEAFIEKFYEEENKETAETSKIDQPVTPKARQKKTKKKKK